MLDIKPKENLTIEDLVSYVYKDSVGTTYSAYELQYQQHSNQFYRYYELYPFFFEEGCYNKAKWNSFHNFICFERDSKSKIKDEQLVKMLFNAFYNNKNFVISGISEISTSAHYIDETFEEYRYRRVWEIQDYLGLKHYGYGTEYNSKPTSKYYREPWKHSYEI